MTRTATARKGATDLSVVVQEFGAMLGESGVISHAEGRMFALLMVSEEPLSQADLRERLSISEGSVSEGLRTLQDMGMVERVDIPKVRRAFFRVHPDAWVNCAESTLRFVLDMDVMAQRLRSLVGKDSPTARRQVNAMSTYYALLARELPKVLRPEPDLGEHRLDGRHDGKVHGPRLS